MELTHEGKIVPLISVFGIFGAYFETVFGVRLLGVLTRIRALS